MDLGMRRKDRVTGHSWNLLRPCLILATLLAACCLIFDNSLSSGVDQTGSSRDLLFTTATDGRGGDASTATKFVVSSLRFRPTYNARRLLESSHEHDSSSGDGNNETDSGPYIVTFFGMDAEDETLRMVHFLQHYVDKLGVLPERCIFVLHSRHGEKAIAKGAKNRAT
jgi:hypothetical protein